MGLQNSRGDMTYQDFDLLLDIISRNAGIPLLIELAVVHEIHEVLHVYYQILF